MLDILFSIAIVIQMMMIVISFLDYLEGHKSLSKTVSLVFFWPLYLIKNLILGFILIFKDEN